MVNNYVVVFVVLVYTLLVWSLAKIPDFQVCAVGDVDLRPGSDERIPVVGVDMEEAERIGLIKIDALGLKTLSVNSRCSCYD